MKRKSLIRAGIAAICILLAQCIQAGDAPLERTVVFRDGTVLRMQLPDGPVKLSILAPDGSLSAATLRLAEVHEARLAVAPRLAEFSRIRAWIGELGHNDFSVRDGAAKALLDLGRAGRADVQAALPFAEDPEAAVRMGRILAAIPAGEPSPGEALFDSIRTAREGPVARAHIQEWSCQARLNGTPLRLDRLNVEGIAADPPRAASLRLPDVAQAVRINDDTEGAFPPDAKRIDFETGPSGERLDAGNDVGRTFIPRGFTISTSIEGAIVSVNNYNVGGRSRGNSCATHDPLWEGTLTIRFCLPGKEHVPAAVSCVGLWIAAVVPDGTALEAYDAHGRKIAEVKTVKGPADFLALRSSTPIASIKIVPNLAVDPNYTFDDLVFDTPRPLDDFGHATLHALKLRSGERIYCRALSVLEGVATMDGMSVGIETLKRPLADVAALTTPLNGWKPSPPPSDLKGCWLKLADGSLLHAVVAREGEEAGGPRNSRVPKLENSAIAAAWPDGAAYAEPPADMRPPIHQQSAVLDPPLLIDGGITSPLHPADFGKLFSEILDGKRKKPVLWLQRVPAARANAGLLVLINGERLVLDDDAFVLKSWTAEDVTLTRGSQTVRLSPSEVMSLTLPVKE